MSGKAKPVKSTVPKRRGAKYEMPDPVPNGEILTDLAKRRWKIGSSIGKGGFGEIYTASEETSKDKNSYVIKIEPKDNGPLFVEMHFLMKVCKEKDIDQYMKSKHLKFLGLPRFAGNGSHVLNGKNYRFVVIDRLGKNLESVLKENNNILHHSSVFKTALQVLDALEYIHSKGYVHADIKASNLLLGNKKSTEDKIYLVDFGLVSRYSSEFKPDPKCAHNGTIEYTSRDAHVGASTQRGDLEILAYNILHWLTAKLPWLDKLQDCVAVHNDKVKYLDDIPALIKYCFGNSSGPKAVHEYLKYLCSLKPTEAPNFEKCREIFKEGLTSASLNNKLDPALHKPVPIKVKNVSPHKVSSRKVSPRKNKGEANKDRMDIQNNEANNAINGKSVVEPRNLRITRGRKPVGNGKGYIDSIDSTSDDETYSPKPTKRKSGEKTTNAKKTRYS